MHDCSRTRSLMLEHLYGLLDEAEAQALLTHVADCARCRAAADAARRDRTLFASAARLSFPDVRFVPPDDEPATLPFARPTPSRRLRFAVAAAAVLAALGLGIPATNFTREYSRLQSEAAAHTAAVAAAREAVDENQKRRADLDATFQRKQKEAVDEAALRQFDVTVTGPARLPTGAPGEYRIATRTPEGRPAPARLDVRLVDAQGHTVLEQKDVASGGDHRLTVGPNLALASGGALALEVAARRDGDDDPRSILRERIELAPPSYVTQLTTDKPIYRPGDTVYFRSLTLDRFALAPPTEDFSLQFRVTTPLKEQKPIAAGTSRLKSGGVEVVGPDGKPLRGVGAGAWTLPADAAGGEYTLTVADAQNRFLPTMRTFLVHRFDPGVFRKELDFDRASYGAGEPVVARVRALRADGTPLVGKTVAATVALDGQDVQTLPPLTADAQGVANVAFHLPKRLETERGTLSVTFDAGGGVVETLVRPIPIVVGGLQVDFYPEGGDLVAGLPGRVYFAARTPADRPADLRGRVVDDTGTVVAAARTIRGLGDLTFVPQAGRTYELIVDAPAGTTTRYRLPEVKAEGVVLTVSQGVSKPGEPIRATVRASGGDRSFLVGLSCRGRLLDHRRLTVAAGATGAVDLTPAQEVGGVYRVTVFEERQTPVPVAERLVYREAARRLRLDVKADRDSYVPGAKASLTVSARDEKGDPTGAVVLVRVVDARTLAAADDRTRPSLPTQFLLTNEVRKGEDLEDADVLLDDGPEARVALDRLLGTQGWRRFAEQQPDDFRKRHGRDADRVLVAVGGLNVRFLDQKLKRLKTDYEGRARDLKQDGERARTAFRTTADDPDAAETLRLFRASEDRLLAFRQGSVPVLAALLTLALVGGLVFGPRTPRRLATAAGALGVGFLLLGALTVKNATDRDERTAARRTEDGQRDTAFAKGDDRAPQGASDDQQVGAMNVGRDTIKPGKAAPPVGPPLAKPLPERDPSPAPPADPTAPGEPLVVREYAHVARPDRDAAARRDFADMLLWRPALVVPVTGSATVTFDLSDAVTTYAVEASGHTLDGRLGATTSQIVSQLPVAIDPRLPTEVNAADRIGVNVVATNATDQDRDIRLVTALKGLKSVDADSTEPLTVPAKGTARRRFTVQPDIGAGEAVVTVRCATDGVERLLRIVPDGFPVSGARSDLIEGVARHEVVLPPAWLPGTLTCRLHVYPSTLAALQQGLEALLREPHGCFEQTSSTTYPNALILGLLRENGAARPEVEARARKMLARGYEKLVAFECPRTGRATPSGFEWFGAPDAAHEALTAYGLLQFTDMNAVVPVDPALRERTRQHLLAARDGQGGFTRSPRALDSFGRAPADVTNAYVVWALTESGEQNVDTELNALVVRAAAAKDAYFLSLVANSLLNRGRADEAAALLKRVAALRSPDGSLDAEASITGSAGRDLKIETTALAILGWLKANRPADFTEPVEAAMRWLTRQRGDTGGFGATQATVMALKALLAHARARKPTPEGGEVSLFVGAKRVGRAAFAAGASDAVVVDVPEAEKVLKPGKNELRVESSCQGALPHTLSWSYRATTPAAAGASAVRLRTGLDRKEVKEGETVRLSVALENATDRGQGMATAVIGLPAGLALPDDLKQLRELVRAPGGVAHFETQGRELVLYWRGLSPQQRVELSVELIARYPGSYRGPASRAYLYYNADAKSWAEPLTVRVD